MDWYGNALMEAHNDGMNSDFKKLALFQTGYARKN